MKKEDTEIVHRVLGIPFPPTIPEEWMETHTKWALNNVYKNNPEKLELMQAGAHFEWEQLEHLTDLSWIRNK